jgi:hypothetical protein
MSAAIDSPRAIRSGEELDVAALEKYLAENLPGFEC